MSGTKPLLFIDVDGVLNRMTTPQKAAKRGLTSARVTRSNGETFLLHLDTGDGPALASMADTFDLAWATTWEHDANTLIAPIIGMPSNLPVAVAAAGEYSKVNGVLRLAAGRPFAWLDDALNTTEKRAIFAASPRSMVIWVNETTGLESHHLDAARAWASTPRD